MYDSPWKEAIETYFADFLAFFFPVAHEGIDWNAEYRFLDKELQQLHPKSEAGMRTVDKLVEVRRIDGEKALVLVHIEIQAQPEALFARRMFVYHYRIFDRYKRPVVSLAVLGDERNSWRPNSFRYDLWGCRLRLDFPVVKLVDYAWDVLALSRNPFAAFVRAHLKSQATRNDPQARKHWKLQVVRGLYEKGYGRKEVRRIFRFVDWLMELPEDLDIQFEEELAEFEAKTNMPYVTGIERRAIKRGLEAGLKEGRVDMARDSILDVLETRFGGVPASIPEMIESIAELDQLRSLLKAASVAESVDAFERHFDGM